MSTLLSLGHRGYSGPTQRVHEGEICSHTDLGLAPNFVTVWSQATPFTSLDFNFLTCKMG